VSWRRLGVLVGCHGGFDSWDDAVQEALLAAAVQWPPGWGAAQPENWLITVASRRLIELWGYESARSRRETVALLGVCYSGSS